MASRALGTRARARGSALRYEQLQLQDHPPVVLLPARFYFRAPFVLAKLSRLSATAGTEGE